MSPTQNHHRHFKSLARRGCRMAIAGFVLAIAAPQVVFTAHARESAAPAASDIERDRPYRSDARPRDDLAAAKKRAAAAGKLVMVTFGANWCADCLALHRNLRDPATQAYARKAFEFVNVDVGDDGKQNLDFAGELGVSVKRGIPVATFLLPNGQPLGNTNGGELEPSRKYSSKQILAFLREVAERRRIVLPSSAEPLVR